MAKSNRKLKIDMSGVESYTRCPEGEHDVRVKKIEMGTVQGSGDDCLKAVFEVLKGDGKGCQVFDTFSLGEKALWKLKQFLMAIGIKADGKLSLDLDKIEGKTCTIDVIHEEYNGQKRAKIANYSKLSAASDDDEDEEDYDEDDEEEEEKPAPKKTSGKKTSKKSAKKPVEDDEEDDEEDDDEDEDEEPAPKSKKSSSKKAAAAKKTPAKKSKKAPEPEDEDDEDDDDDWDEDDDD